MCHRSRLWQPTVVRRSPFSRGSAESQRAVPKKNIECVCMVPCPVFPPPHGIGPQVAPPSLVFASYCQHFYLLGLCSILTTSLAFTGYMLPFRQPT